VSHLESGLGFTAISHVWSDGLGNVHENALPKCQLEHLQRAVDDLVYQKITSIEMSKSKSVLTSVKDQFLRKIPSTFPEAPYLRKIRQAGRVHNKNFFWIDTLCIPLEPLNLRKDAIRRIADVFQKAAQVLVLDNNLQLSLHPKSTPNIEILLVGVPEVSEISNISTTDGLLVQLSSSAWMRRLWTFSEGALASELYVKLSDGFLLYDNLIWQNIRDRESTLAGNGCRMLAQELLNVRMTQASVRKQFTFAVALKARLAMQISQYSFAFLLHLLKNFMIESLMS